MWYSKVVEVDMDFDIEEWEPEEVANEINAAKPEWREKLLKSIGDMGPKQSSVDAIIASGVIKESDLLEWVKNNQTLLVELTKSFPGI